MNPKLWTKNFILVAVSNFLIYFVYYMLMVIVAKYAGKTMHVSAWEAGLASSLFILGGLFARILAGRVISQLGDKKVLIIGLAFYFVTCLLYFPVTGITALLVVRFFHGIGFGFSATGAATTAAHIIPVNRQGEGISYYALSMTLGMALGPFAGITIYADGSLNTILFLCIAAMLVCAALVPFIREPSGNLTREAGQPEGQAGQSAETTLPRVNKSSIHSFLEITALPVSVLCALMVVAYCSILTFLSSFTDTKELLPASKWFFVIYSACALVTRPFAGRIFDRRGANILMYPCILLFAAGMLTLAFAYSGFTLLCSAVLIGLGYNTFFSTANAIVIKESPRDRVHLATATYYAFADLGVGVGPFLLGLFIPFSGYRGMYLGMAVFVLCLMVVYYYIHGKKGYRG